jgi:hypothetical protein
MYELQIGLTLSIAFAFAYEHVMLYAHLQMLWQEAESSLGAVKAQQACLLDAAGTATHVLEKIATAADAKQLQAAVKVQQDAVAVAQLLSDKVQESLDAVGQAHSVLQAKLTAAAAQHHTATAAAAEVQALQHKASLQHQELAAAQAAHDVQYTLLAEAEQLLGAVMQALAAQSPRKIVHKWCQSKKEVWVERYRKSVLPVLVQDWRSCNEDSTAASERAAAANPLFSSPALSVLAFVMKLSHLHVCMAKLPPMFGFGPAEEVKSMTWRTAVALYLSCAVIGECVLLLQLIPQSVWCEYKGVWVERYKKTVMPRLVQWCCNSDSS